MSFLNDLNQIFPIVDPNTGQPTDYFMRLIRDRGIESLTLEEQLQVLSQEFTTLESLVNAINGTSFTAGTGLLGGGTLGIDDPINYTLNAEINDLTDVDTATTPPTNGQALVWDNASSLWVPGTISGGGGGGGGGSFKGARVYASVDFSQGSGNNLITAFNTVDFDVGSWWNPAGYFTIPASVEYITATLYLTDSANVTGQLIPVIQHRDSSGTLIGVITQSDYESAGGDSGETTTGAFKITAGDRIYPNTFLTNSRTLDGGKYGCAFSIHAL